jgi:hypothetical protein
MRAGCCDPAPARTRLNDLPPMKSPTDPVDPGGFIPSPQTALSYGYNLNVPATV